MPGSAADYPVLHLADQSAWAEWLEQHHSSERGIWLRLARRASELRSPSFDEARDTALCYGWIDGQAKSYDAESWLQKFTPRGKRSTWSKRNREHCERLIRSGAMRPAGLAAIEAAKQDGRWDRAYDSPATAEVPPDLRAALQADPDALAFFETLNSRNRFSILHRVQTAVKPETRARRIENFVRMLHRGETPHP